MEKTLALVKPDGVENNHIGEILYYYEKAGLKIKALKMIKINKEFARQHYIDLKDKPFYGELVDFISRSPLVALILEGEDAVNKVRGINGATDPKDAKEGTIRHKYAKDKTENTVHGSDSVENAKREISMWFPEFLDSYLDN
ncbi:MAG: nucleoside-diphosphate kinase [Clostridium sp.]|jgi:nucleoside-diphosphate kinase